MGVDNNNFYGKNCKEEVSVSNNKGCIKDIPLTDKMLKESYYVLEKTASIAHLAIEKKQYFFGKVADDNSEKEAESTSLKDQFEQNIRFILKNLEIIKNFLEEI